MIEDDLRSLLAERAGGLPDNPGRPAEIRSRITATRRRRVAGGALGLVLLALAGLLAIRFPGSNESLPPGVPAPPYFDRVGRATVPGHTGVRTADDLTEPHDDIITASYGTSYSRHLIVARCQRPAVGAVRNTGGPRFTVDCSRRVGDHFEGVTALDPAQAGELLAHVPPEVYVGGLNVRFEPGSEGPWVIAILRVNAPESLPPHTDRGSPLLAEGARARTGTTVGITVPPARVPDAGERIEIAMSFVTECVAGVRLVFSVPAGELGTADCDPLGKEMTDGRVGIDVLKTQLARLGLRPADRVAVTIRSVGRDTDQWRVFPPN